MLINVLLLHCRNFKPTRKMQPALQLTFQGLAKVWNSLNVQPGDDDQSKRKFHLQRNDSFLKAFIITYSLGRCLTKLKPNSDLLMIDLPSSHTLAKPLVNRCPLVLLFRKEKTSSS